MNSERRLWVKDPIWTAKNLRDNRVLKNNKKNHNLKSNQIKIPSKKLAERHTLGSLDKAQTGLLSLKG